MKIGIFLLYLIFFSNLALAQRGEFNYSRIEYGQEVQSLSARMLSMGNSGLAGQDGFSGLYLNPAMIAGGPRVFSVSGGFMMDKAEEDRSYPYYDAFGGFTDYGSYFYNKNWYPYFYGNVTFAIPLSFLPGLKGGVGFFPFIDFNYDYLEAVGQPNRVPDNRKDKLLGYNSIVSTGRLSIIPVALAAPVLDNLKVGLQIGILQGDVNNRHAVEPFEENVPPEDVDEIRRSFTVDRSLQNTPLVGTFGANYQVNDRLAVAATFRAPYQVQYNYDHNLMWLDTLTQNGRQTLDYPMRVGAGLSYRFENILAAQLYFDIIYEFWSDFKDNLNQDLDYNNTYTVNTGVEHMFLSKVPIRAGFSYQILRDDKSFSKAMISAGTGFMFNNIRFDLGGGISFLEYHQADLFDDAIYGLVSRKNDLDRVKLTYFYGRIDVNYEF